MQSDRKKLNCTVLKSQFSLVASKDILSERNGSSFLSLSTHLYKSAICPCSDTALAVAAEAAEQFVVNRVFPVISCGLLMLMHGTAPVILLQLLLRRKRYTGRNGRLDYCNAIALSSV